MSIRMVFSSPRNQNGAALVIGLIFLVLVSLIATIGMRQSITQERMAGGLRNGSIARNAAETAVRIGERQIYEWYLTSSGEMLVERGSLPSGIGIQGADFATAVAFRAAPPGTFMTTGASVVANYTSTADSTAQPAQQPVFLIESLGPVRRSGVARESGATGAGNVSSQSPDAGLYAYRITARATGGLESVVRTAESTFVVRPQG